MFRFFALGLAFTLAACESVTATPTASTQQTWLCGKEYVNHAWGYQRRGIVLDTSGNVWKYEAGGAAGRSAQPWAPTDMTRLTEAELKMRYEGAGVTHTKVPAVEISQILPLISEASNATPSKPQPKGADMGQTLTYCYTFDSVARTYSQVMIDNVGDWTSTNPSPAARQIAQWIQRYAVSDL